MSDSVAIGDTTLTDTSKEQCMIYSQRDLWYFKTSDGREIGPFRYRSEAETGLHRLLGQGGKTH